MKQLIGTLCALAVVTVTYAPALAVRKGQLESDLPWTLEVTANTGPTAVTIFELGDDRIRRVTSITVALNETVQMEFPAPRTLRRVFVELDLPDGTSSARIKITSAGAPVFPEETVSADTRYALDVL